jgi:hypothetical protein
MSCIRSLMNRPRSLNQASSLTQAVFMVSVDLSLAAIFSGRHISRNCWNSSCVGVPWW